MAKRISAALGIDVGTQSVKAATVRMTKDGAVLSGLGFAPTPEGSVDHTGILDPMSVGQAVKAAAAESGGCKDVVFCINGSQSVVVRLLEVPKMTDAELSDHMNWEIQRNVPFAEPNVVSDFRPVDNPSLQDSQNMEVVMAVSPQSAIDLILSVVKNAGLKPAAIDVEPLGMGRVLDTCHRSDVGSKSVCMVNIGHSTTAINMYRGGTLAFPRTVPLGGAMLTKAISDGLNVDLATAEERKVASAFIPDTAGAGGGFTVPSAQTTSVYDYGEGGEQAGEGGEAPIASFEEESSHLYRYMESSLEEIVSEVRRSIDYYRSRGGDIDMIVLCGGCANIRGIESFVSRSIGITTVKANPFQGIGLEVRGVGETYLSSKASDFVVAVGMGLHIAYD